MNKDLLKRVGMLTASCRLPWRIFGALTLNGLQAIYASDGGQLVAAAVGRTGGTHRAVRYGLR